jgi:uncharacterized protein (DUF2342 family)
VPANVAAFAEGLDVPPTTSASTWPSARPPTSALRRRPWLREHLLGAVTAYAEGIEVNVEGIQQRVEEQMRGIDPSNPEAMQQLLEGGMFELPDSPAAEGGARAARGHARPRRGLGRRGRRPGHRERMPNAARCRRRSAAARAGGPAEQTFATLVGLELRPAPAPRRLDAVGLAAHRQGIEARDGVWMHPDLLPTASDLDDPLGFREGTPRPEALSDDGLRRRRCASCST